MNIIKEILKELKANVDLKYKEDSQKYSKDPIKCLGVRAPDVKQISIIYYNQIKKLSKDEILELCESLLNNGYTEPKHMAFWWSFRAKKKLDKKDFNRFEGWIKKYINYWGLCDDFCTHTVNHMIETYPDLIPKVKKWTNSRNKWFRRASAVAFVPSARKGRYHKDVFEIAEMLLLDKEDMVQKGYGWMLKEASNYDQKAVFDFVMRYKKEMPRTALRYAIEKMSDNMRKEAMRKD